MAILLKFNNKYLFYLNSRLYPKKMANKNITQIMAGAHYHHT